jgi:hypothetical protein
MKPILIITLSLFILSKSFGQIDFKGDSITTLKFPMLSLIDSVYKLDKDYDFEFRLWTSPSLVKYANVFILSQKNKVWSARFFEFDVKQNQNISEKTVDQSKLNKLWTRLEENKVLTLPTQESVIKKLKIYVAEPSAALEGEDYVMQVGMSDGTMYYFELATQHKRRSYSYHSPKAYLKHYPNTEELYRAYVLIILVRKYLGLNLTVV